MFEFINFNLDYTFLKQWSFILVLLNIIVYVLTLFVFFSLILLIDTSIFKLTSDFKNLSRSSFVINCVTFLFLSLAGMPPFFSFIGKFLLFVFIFSSSNFISILIFFFFNCFIIYFYIQHIRLLVTKHKNFIFLIKRFFFFLKFSYTLVIY